MQALGVERGALAPRVAPDVARRARRAPGCGGPREDEELFERQPEQPPVDAGVEVPGTRRAGGRRRKPPPRVQRTCPAGAAGRGVRVLAFILAPFVRVGRGSLPRAKPPRSGLRPRLAPRAGHVQIEVLDLAEA